MSVDLSSYAYNPEAYVDDPTCEDAIVYWHHYLRSVIVANHPMRGQVLDGYPVMDDDDLHHDGVEAVMAALGEFDPTRWDRSLSAFLHIRVPQRLHDHVRSARKSNRRASTVSRIAADIDAGRRLPRAVLVEEIKASGKWPQWLGPCTLAKVTDGIESSLASVEVFHTRWEEPNRDGLMLAETVAAPGSAVEEMLDTDDDDRLRHVVGLDVEVLLTGSGSDMTFALMEADPMLLPRHGQVVQWAPVRREAVAFAKSRETLETEQFLWQSRTVRACDRCGLVWPMSGSECGRPECRYGQRRVPGGFTVEYWHGVQERLGLTPVTIPAVGVSVAA